MQMSQFKIYAPLQNFFWSGNNYELTPVLWIKNYCNQKPELPELDANLSQSEQSDFNSGAWHWLTFQWIEGTEPLPSETVNLVLVAMWLVKPTATHVAFQFKHFQELAKTGVARKHDRFTWLPKDAHKRFDDSDLQSVSSYYPALRDICCARGGRLNNALMLTLTGCWSIHWQTSLICHAAAVEALLTYSTDPGITRRLAISYACLVETQNASRHTAYNEFCTLYSIRSDIMHGRSHNVPPSERLPILARFQNVLRTLWRTVISSPQLISKLEDSDSLRDKYLSQLASNYTPPSRNP